MHSKVLKFRIVIIALFLINMICEATYLQIVTEDWPPYNYVSDEKLTGFSYEIVQHIIEDLNLDIEIKIYPGNRSTRLLDIDKRVMFFSLFRNEVRENKYKWIGPLAKDKFYFYKRKGSNLVIKTLDDVKKVKKIATRSTGVVYRYLAANEVTNLDVSINNESIYMKLISGRVDLAIADTPVGVIYMLNKLGYTADVIEQTQLGVLEKSLYIAASKDIPDEEIELWQQSLDKLKANGVYNVIYKKYLK